LKKLLDSANELSDKLKNDKQNLQLQLEKLHTLEDEKAIKEPISEEK
jgi:hypothetical protein